jgi:LmbE family N-acetylglucosaminyl deacetylase
LEISPGFLFLENAKFAVCTMKILYVFPHPDDESFGPAPAIAAQIRQGHEVYLLTLTKGEATKQRFRLGVSKEEMGNIRYKEMKCVEEVLGLSGMTVLDFPDGELKHLNPIQLEEAIDDHIEKIGAEIVITYAVHGISGFHDHLVTHAVVKRVFAERKKQRKELPLRLAFFTRMGEVDLTGKFRLEVSNEEEIHFIEECEQQDMAKFEAALDCYETYQQIIKDSNVKEVTTNRVPFEIYGKPKGYRLSGESISTGLKKKR